MSVEKWAELEYKFGCINDVDRYRRSTFVPRFIVMRCNYLSHKKTLRYKRFPWVMASSGLKKRQQFIFKCIGILYFTCPHNQCVPAQSFKVLYVFPVPVHVFI